MIRVLIIDDEPKSINILRHYIEAHIPEIKEIKTACSVREAKEILQGYKPEIVFLDIEMPGQSGFELLESSVKPSFDVIFITAYNQYAIQAIRCSALDYLLKPIDPDELISAVCRHSANRESAEKKQELYDNLLKNIRKKDIREFRLGIPSNQGIFFFPIAEIVRLEGDRNYTNIHLTGSCPFHSCKNLKYFEDILTQFRFVRTHKSHLINISHVAHISKNHELLIMSDNEKIEVSRRRKDQLLRMLNVS